MNRFSALLAKHNILLRRDETQILQINVGKKCNQTCVHCHVNAGPARREMMTRQTMERILEWLGKTDISTVDITGGAPELNPHFRFLVQEVRALNRRVMDRCNLTILFEAGQENLAEFLAQHEVEIVASLPCYGPENVDAQRGDGVFEKSIGALQKLNALSYAHHENLILNLVYNPNGAFLPPSQKALEDDYRMRLRDDFGIEFNQLFTITNMPISRFASYLQRAGQWDEYQELLANSFNPHSVAGLMCRNTLNIGWRGEVYDCDFNQMLEMPWRDSQNASLYLWEIDPQNIELRPILTDSHCLGCTAGAGSSCGGALVS